MSGVQTRVDATPVLGPRTKRAMRTYVGGDKRRKLLVLLAAYLDAGVDDPSVRELRQRTGFDTRKTLQLLRLLEKSGFIAVQWGDPHAGERNRYALKEPYAR